MTFNTKDLIVTFNWDPLLPQAYRRWRHLGHVLPQIAFLHGNVDVSVNMEARQVRFTSDLGPGDGAFQPSRLLYPVAKKDYNSDPFTKGQWDMSLDYMRHSYYVTVYGYSAPRTDVEARQLLLDAWQNNTTRSLAEFDVVDIAPKAAVEASWAEFIVSTHGSVWDSFEHNILKQNPRRSCEAFAFATLQQTPWDEDPFPAAATLDDLDSWIRPLLAEEASGNLAGDPHH
ncbi:MAG: hypothetical protein KJ944_01345 [Alphaproteobacteria bacterium]|nr:hypothetical protein [Alphaproteobacteria bacterium]MBU1560044.1 hypothetical protein [Alphaproteobacteria bacterium]MBU2301221.1 hypothetical protein [Alphaproteobacteria bacterium]MBU2366684.1 hypothetical protein [Alphaproteobacteria bacterium]